MRHPTEIAVALIALTVMTYTFWNAYGAANRAREVNATVGTITVRATGRFNKTVSVTDTNPRGNAAADLSSVEEHALTYKRLGFDRVEVTTPSDTLDKPF